MFNPIKASHEIKQRYIDYITTSLSFADEQLQRNLNARLNDPDMIAKGPYLEVGDSYKTGKNIDQLIKDGVVSPLFESLEQDKEESDKEIKLFRPLYVHQQEAIEKANKGHSLVVTSGTGSGKTESFVIPIINQLLKEQEAGQLDVGVRAILIYPMNALANDQMKRLRVLLSSYEKITFGVYTGNTQNSQASALQEYRMLFRDDNNQPLTPGRNELISRERMQENPPHILITNYAMLEYMLLRPNDDKVFQNAQLKFVVLDEAHTYRGATGIETSLLIRRLKARIAKNPVQFIITSATLGGKEEDNSIVQFAQNLCDEKFDVNDIIRSTPLKPTLPPEIKDYPNTIYSDLLNPSLQLDETFKKYDFDVKYKLNDSEKIYLFALQDRGYHLLRTILTEPMTIDELLAHDEVAQIYNHQNLVDMINLYSLAEKDKTSLIKARYHFFVRALEGAYACISSKDLFLSRKKTALIGNVEHKVFELSVCNECGRHAVVGKIERDSLNQSSREYDDVIHHYLVMNDQEEQLIADEEEEENVSDEFILCTRCGEIHQRTIGAKLNCSCGAEYRRYVKEAQRSETTERSKCPACNTGHFRQFYLGYDAATSVLASELFEQIPASEVVRKHRVETKTDSFFDNPIPSSTETIQRTKQFLSFSDNRNDAAYFSSFLNNSYNEILRRRAMYQIIQENSKDLNSDGIPVNLFVEKLRDRFVSSRIFHNQEENSMQNSAVCNRQAWLTVMNEIVNARRNTSFTSFGLVSFEYIGNKNIDVGIKRIAEKYQLQPSDVKALFDYYVQDILLYGCFKGNIELTDEERDYVFYSPIQKYIVLRKSSDNKRKTNLYGFLPSVHSISGKLLQNSRLIRTLSLPGLDKEVGLKLMEDYFNSVLLGANNPHRLIGSAGEYLLKTDSLIIKKPSEIYECDVCKKITPINMGNRCSSIKCQGKLHPINQDSLLSHNHYINLYTEKELLPLRAKEHTAQLSKEQQQRYQNEFIEKKINALSCSTTFEMGVDIGDLQTVLMRNLPPSPANYVQRAGRAGRRSKSSAYALTFAKLSSHDFTYFEHPRDMISGRIRVPHFVIENEKIVYRHIFAIALSSFFATNQEVYGNNNGAKLLLENGYELLKSYLATKPKDLLGLLEKSIPVELHNRLGIHDFGWVDRLVGDEGVLTISIEDFRNQVQWYDEKIAEAASQRQFEVADRLSKQKERLIGGRNEKIDLIEFLVRSNVLPKYGFPVDTVELYTTTNFLATDKQVNLSRDMQLAISEYAPGSQVVADNKLYTSRYIRKIPSQNNQRDWEINYIATCSAVNCATINYKKTEITDNHERCIACGTEIPKAKWEKSIEPRKGFMVDIKAIKDVPMKKPDRNYKSDDFYIGDSERRALSIFEYNVNGNPVILRSTTNDSLMVVTNDDFYTCDVCGFSMSKNELKKEKKFNPTLPYFNIAHVSSSGYPCKSQLKRSRISHSFKTDVVSLVFNSPFARDYATMLSVMNALLEAISYKLDIERNDIKGCLHKTHYDEKLLFSIIIYDAVAGGAGHVRRLVTENGEVFKEVIGEAFTITNECSCDPSCYMCIRNYSNQKYHDILDRYKAAEFLKHYRGDVSVSGVDMSQIVRKASQKSEVRFDSITYIEGYNLRDYQDWESIRFLFDDAETLVADLIKNSVRMPDECFVQFLGNGNQRYVFEFMWQAEKILVANGEVSESIISDWHILPKSDENLISKLPKKG
jgi:ATP-dependent helicase YprA (DUF1998 family)